MKKIVFFQKQLHNTMMMTNEEREKKDKAHYI